MSTSFHSGTDHAASIAGDELAGTAERLDQHSPHSRVDSNSVRWVFAATVAFWLVVYAAGRSFF